MTRSSCTSLKLTNSIQFRTDSDLQAPHEYFNIAYKLVPSLAEDLSRKIMFIRKNGAETIEFIGHGMGAHVAAQAGKLLKVKMGYTVDRIIGNDFDNVLQRIVRLFIYTQIRS